MWGAGGTSVPGAGSQGAEQVGTRIAEWRGAGLAQVVLILFRVAQNVSVFPYARAAILLVYGDKSGRWEKWYRTAIPAPSSCTTIILPSAGRRWGHQRRGMTQEQVASLMGVSVARVSQIESGDVSTPGRAQPVRRRLGGTLKLIADFGDEQLKLA
jgi:hypothetical protein